MKTKAEIKKWLYEKKEFTSDEFIQWFERSDIDIPEGIRFVDFEKDNTLGLVFNEGRQILVIDRDDNVFETLSYNYIQKRGIEEIPCKLIECKYEDLEVGDIFIGIKSGNDIEEMKNLLCEYDIYLGNKKRVFINQNTDILTIGFDKDNIHNFYKVVKK